jgi:copper(I)-binding protein
LPAARKISPVVNNNGIHVMKRLMQLTIALAAISAALTHTAFAADFQAGNLVVKGAHARPTVPGQSSGAAYLSIDNNGKTSDKLVHVSTPLAASAEVHSTSMDGGIMRMREVDALELQPAAHVTMSPGDGYHIMLVGLKKALVPGQKVPLSLRFEKAGKLDIEVVVDDK